MDFSKLTTLKLNLFLLGQVVESARVRAEMLEAEAEEQDTDSALDSLKTANFIRQSVAHVELAMAQFSTTNSSNE